MSPDEGGVGCGLLPLMAGMLMLPEALENLLHLQSLNSGIPVAGFLGQLQSMDTLEDAWSTFPRCLLWTCVSVVPKCFVHHNGWEALSSMLQRYLEPTESEASGIT